MRSCPCPPRTTPTCPGAKPRANADAPLAWALPGRVLFVSWPRDEPAVPAPCTARVGRRGGEPDPTVVAAPAAPQASPAARAAAFKRVPAQRRLQHATGRHALPCR